MAWQCCLAVLLGCALHSFTHSSQPCILMATVVPIEIAEATCKSQELGHQETQWALTQLQQVNVEGPVTRATPPGLEADLFIFSKSPYLSNSEI